MSKEQLTPNDSGEFSEATYMLAFTGKLLATRQQVVDLRLVKRADSSRPPPNLHLPNKRSSA
jgi:hypothetical protein